jgi:hypothetical protein
MLTQPRVLFLDEPTTGLDPRSRNEIWDIVRYLRREGTTILLTTQYLEEADELADQIAVIDHGRVIAKGTGNELKDRVGGHILEVELTDVQQRDAAMAALLRIGCGQPEQDGRPDRLTLPAPRESLVLVEEAAAELRRAGIEVSEMGLRGPTLDDVFLQLTGQPPSENGGPQSTAAVAAIAVERPRRLWRPTAISLHDVRSSLNDLAVVTVRNLRHFWRQPDLLLFSTIQLGRTTADLVRNVLITGLMIFVGYLVGFRFEAGVLPALGCVALVAAFGFALSWIFAFVSLVVRGAESAQTAGFVLLFPLVFASSVFVPVSSMPSWLQSFAKASPVTLTADAARTLALTGGVPSSLWESLAWIVGILAVFIPLSVWRYRRMS